MHRSSSLRVLIVTPSGGVRVASLASRVPMVDLCCVAVASEDIYVLMNE